MERAQGSIEYLMTYAWAIIVIAVAISALYALGFFNLGNFAVKAQPGGCQVYRPSGPGSVQMITLQGRQDRRPHNKDEGPPSREEAKSNAHNREGVCNDTRTDGN